MSLNKNERKFLATAVLYGWTAYEQHDGKWLWDNDYMLPVKIGPVAKSLVAKGVMESFYIHGRGHYRGTAVGRTYRCGRYLCDKGKLHRWNEDESYTVPTGEICPDCDGIGILAEPYKAPSNAEVKPE